jgi:hypothetical protein
VSHKYRKADEGRDGRSYNWSGEKYGYASGQQFRITQR